jgi:hypothetical protein
MGDAQVAGIYYDLSCLIVNFSRCNIHGTLYFPSYRQ